MSNHIDKDDPIRYTMDKSELERYIHFCYEHYSILMQTSQMTHIKYYEEMGMIDTTKSNPLMVYQIESIPETSTSEKVYQVKSFIFHDSPEHWYLVELSNYTRYMMGRVEITITKDYRLSYRECDINNMTEKEINEERIKIQNAIADDQVNVEYGNYDKLLLLDNAIQVINERY